MTTPDPFLVFYMSLLVLSLAYMSMAWRLSFIKHRRNRKPTMQERDEGFAGKHLKGYKPRTTPHSIINRLFSKPRTIAATVIGLLDEFADVSFYQGGIDWAKMRTKARKVIIRAGQNTWVDIKFVVNYAAAKVFGFQRGIYFFYDGRASPGKQAALLVSLIKADSPELGIWIDWERNFGGAWEGIKNVVAMMQEVERLLPGVEVGIYTGYYFFIENSNPILHRSQYEYLKTKKLWLAFYAPLANVLIPSLWPFMTYWQKGTPSRGAEYGVESKEIDMNEDMDGDPDPTPIPPEEEPMTITFTGKVKDASAQNANVRVDADTTATPVGTLAPGTAFTAEGQKVFNDGYDWLNISIPVHGWLALTTNIEYQPVTLPPVTPFPFRVTGTSLTLHAVDEAGVKWQATIAVNMADAVEFQRET